MNSADFIEQKTIEQFLGRFKKVKKDYRFGKGIAVYSVSDAIFAVLVEGSKPVQLSLLCNPELAKSLRERYESVMPAERLNPNKWNTILLSGQLTKLEVDDLIFHSYQIASSG